MKSALFGASFVLRTALILLIALCAHAKFGFFPSQEHPNPPDAFGNRHPYWGVFLVFGILALNLLFFLRLGKDISQRVWIFGSIGILSVLSISFAISIRL